MIEGRIVRLGDVCKQDRATVKTGERTDLRYIGLESIEANTGQFNEGELSKTPESPQANSFRFGSEHVLYGKLRPYLNKVVLADFEGKCSTEIIPLLPNTELDRRYLGYFLRSPLTVSRISEKTAGARMPRADMDFIFGLEINLPSLAEQRRIVDILSRAEGIVRLRREAEKKAAELIPALFLDMFGDPATNPKEWPVAALGDVCTINPRLDKHQKPTADSIVSFVPMAAVDGIRGEVAIIEPRSYASVAKGFTPFIEGDVLFAKITPCMENGKAAIVPELVGGFGFGSTEFHVLRSTEHLHKAWLLGFVRREAFRHQAKLNFSGTAGQQRVPTEYLKTLNVPVPDFKTQIAFAQALEQIRSIQSQQSVATGIAQATFDALLSQVFAKTNNMS